jgi:DNA repair exonuclease SbcCD ATPase subunit
MRTPEQIGAEMLKNSLKNVKDAQSEMDKATAEAMRGDLLLDEIQLLEGANKAAIGMIEGLEKRIPNLSARRARAAEEEIERIRTNLTARELALDDLNEILDDELKAETANNKRIQLEKDIQDEKNRRAREKKDREDRRKTKKREEDAFKNEKERIDREAREELNVYKQGLLDKQITQASFDEAAFDMEQQRLQNQLDLLIKYGEDTSVINGQILSNELKMIADKAAAEAKAAQDKLEQDAQAKKDREEQIASVAEMGNQLITLAGEDKKLQEIKKVGIQISTAAAIANNIEALSLAATGAAKQSTLLFPANIVAMLSTVTTIMSLFANIRALKNSFGDGGVIEAFANGGMVQGKSHAQGGEKFAVGGRVVELEGGEAVINKRSTAMFRSQLSAMNAAGGGVKFADGGLLNMPSFSQQQFNALGQNQMMGAMAGGNKVVVVEADITASQNAVSVIQSDATV